MATAVTLRSTSGMLPCSRVPEYASRAGADQALGQSRGSSPQRPAKLLLCCAVHAFVWLLLSHCEVQVACYRAAGSRNTSRAQAPIRLWDRAVEARPSGPPRGHALRYATAPRSSCYVIVPILPPTYGCMQSRGAEFCARAGRLLRRHRARVLELASPTGPGLFFFFFVLGGWRGRPLLFFFFSTWPLSGSSRVEGRTLSSSSFF